MTQRVSSDAMYRGGPPVEHRPAPARAPTTPSGVYTPTAPIPDRKPTWRDVVEGNLDEAEAARPRKQVRRTTPIDLTPHMKQIVTVAAARRGLSIAAYARRAVMAFAARDLGLDWWETMTDEPQVRTSASSAKSELGPGVGFGPWKIEGLGQWEPPK
jgi:hypothetical protein